MSHPPALAWSWGEPDKVQGTQVPRWRSPIITHRPQTFGQRPIAGPHGPKQRPFRCLSAPAAACAASANTASKAKFRTNLRIGIFPPHGQLVPGIYAKNSRATPCKQRRAAALAWSWDETVSIGFYRCLVRLGHTSVVKDKRNACAAPVTVGRGSTPSAAVTVPMLVSTGSSMRR